MVEQMPRAFRNVGSAERPLQQRPEVFDGVRVNLSVHVADGVIDHIVNVGGL